MSRSPIVRTMRLLSFALCLGLAACGEPPKSTESSSTPRDTAEATTDAASNSAPDTSIFGTREPFASEAIYFVVTDRFVNGDPSNDQREQGGDYRSFDIPLNGPNGGTDNIGYLGGDFKGVLNHADYIRDMGLPGLDHAHRRQSRCRLCGWRRNPVGQHPDRPWQGGLSRLLGREFLASR